MSINTKNTYINTAVNKLAKALLEGKKYCLVCYEKDHKHCHRYLIAKWLEEKYGIEWKEY